MARTGRPKKYIDESLLESLLRVGAPLVDCAGELNVSDDTLEKFIKKKHKMTFTEYRHKKMAPTRSRLRQKMLETAMKGNVTMMIWCSKNMLGWKEKVETSEAQEDGFEFVRGDGDA